MYVCRLRIMTAFLHQPYPYYYERHRLWKLALTLGAATTVFLYAFKPVGIENGLIHGLFITCLLYGVLAGAMFFLYFRFMPLLLRSAFNPDNWTVAREMLAFSGLFLMAGVVNFIVQPYMYSTSIPELTVLLQDIKNTFLVGFLILGVMTATNFAYLFRSQEEKAELLRLILQREEETTEAGSVGPVVPDTTEVQITGPHEQFTIKPETVLFAKADGNYVEFHLLSSDQVQVELRRIPLKTVEEQLRDFHNIFRVHRAYLLNRNAIGVIEGNAQGYRVSVRHSDHQVPVSRTYLDDFNHAVSSAKHGRGERVTAD